MGIDKITPRFGHKYYGIANSRNILDHGLTIDDVFDKVITIHKDIAKIFNLDPSQVKKIILDVTPCLSNYIEYKYGFVSNGLLLKKDHGERTHYNHSTRRMETTYYDLYLVKRSSPCDISKVIKYILNQLYPQIFYNPKFYNVEERYKAKSIKHITTQTRLFDIGNVLYDEFVDAYDYTVKDLIDLLSQRSNLNEERQKSSFEIYYNDYSEKEPISIYLHLPNINGALVSLTIPLEAIKKHDFSLVENCVVRAIPCYPNEKKWYTGKQKDAPYFNHHFVEELKNCFKNLDN